MSEPQSIASAIKDHSEEIKKTWFSAYTLVITLLGVILLLISTYHIEEKMLPGLALFASMVFIAELSSVELFITSRFSTVSVTSVIVTGSIPLFGPAGAVLLMAVSGIATAISTTFLRKEQPGTNRVSMWRRTGFNIGMFCVSGFCGGWVYLLTGGSIAKVLALSNLLPFVLSVISLNVINTLLLVTVIALQTGRNPFQIWRQNFSWAVQIAVMGGLVGGSGLAVIFERLGMVGAIVMFLPVLALGYSFQLYQTNMKGYVTRLEETNNELNDANMGLLETLGAMIDAYDVFTSGHSAQVAIYASTISRYMGVNQEEQNHIFRAALIHDIGKIGVPELIIGKQGRLTEDETRVMRQHPIIGADILRRTKGLHVYIPLVRYHHERWDGKGYPAGLAKEEIPLGARVIALADSIDAMSSDRPYRKCLPGEAIRDEVVKGRGTQFDPLVVDAFLAILDEMGMSFFKNSAQLVDHDLTESQIKGVNLSLRYLKKSLLINVQDEP